MPGTDVCREIRRIGRIPVVMVTAKDTDADKVVGLEMGADDYITKPFSMREFRSRVKAALRRSRMVGAAADEEPISSGDLRIDFERRTVVVRAEDIRLTYVEFEILAALARAPGRVLTRETLLSALDSLTPERLRTMAKASAAAGHRDAAERVLDVLKEATHQ
jgi:DNA-binding response OmpR family regulator